VSSRSGEASCELLYSTLLYFTQTKPNNLCCESAGRPLPSTSTSTSTSTLRSHLATLWLVFTGYELLSVSSSNWQSSSSELCTAQRPGISLKNCAMSLICRWARGRLRSSTSSLRHAALLLTTVQLPQLHVPGFVTVFLMMSRLPHLY